MTMTGLDAFDQTLHKTHVWLQDVMEELQWDDRHRAYMALRGTLHALRNRLNVDEATDLGAQLPMLVRGFYYEGWEPSKTPVKERHKEEFLTHIRETFHTTAAPPDIDPEPVARAVFKVLSKHVTEGEIKDVKAFLPKELEELWPVSTPA